MKIWLIGVPVVVAAIVSAVTGEYIAGRILAPELGLTAPGWWACLWASLLLGLFAAPVWFVKGMIDAA